MAIADSGDTSRICRVSDKLTPAELAAVKAKYGLSRDVERLSLGGRSPVLKPTGLTTVPCGTGPDQETAPQGSISNANSINIRSARKERGRANLLPESSGAASELERSCGDGTLGPGKPQKVLGKIFRVRVTSIRCRLLDVDNLCEKYFVDLLRYAGVIPSDDPASTQIEVRQQKADPGSPEETLIEVFKL